MIQIPVDLQNFITFFLSIIIESLPFVILGVIVSVLVALFISEDMLLKFLPKNRFGSHIFFALIGILIPVCQCGNVPVARRFIMKGFSPSQAMTFLLASPIVNPLTFFTTYFAFSTIHSFAFLRILFGFIIAVSIGIFLSYKKDQNTYLTQEFVAFCEKQHTMKKSLASAYEIFQSEFLIIMKMLSLGAFIAAAIHEFLPQTVLLSVGQNPLLSLFAMMVIGFVFSICSTVDAFFALSYLSTFTVGSLLTFLIFAPVINIKMIALMRTTFRINLVIKLSLVIALVTLVIGFVYNLL
jgi:uncharacterized protein